MTFVGMIALALALASTTAWNSHPSGSERDQYEAREDGPLSHLLNEATDHRLEARQSVFKQSTRRKRSFTPWTGQMIFVEPNQSINKWKPPIYALSRPYFIPIYGVQGKPPIYYPPQALSANKPFRGPTYLPPVESTTMTIGSRFNDDAPVWDTVSAATTSVVPTRRPPGTTSPPPPLVRTPSNSEGVSTSPPTTTSTTTTPASPPAPAAAQRRPRPEPSRCVWAIISCCTNTNQIVYECFEQRGCVGAFWGTNPCDSEFTQAAISAALNYYNNNNN